MKAILLLLIVTACSLDPSEKPVCVDNNDCYPFPTGLKCVEHQCIADMDPVGAPDVIYVRGNPERVSANVVANDVDPDGDELQIRDVIAPTVTAEFDPETRTTITLDVPESLPVTLHYVLAAWDVGYGPNYDTDELVPVTVATLPSALHVALDPSGSVDLGAKLAAIPGIEAATVTLGTPPTTGALTGPPTTAQYTASATCGTDALAFHIVAANGMFDLPVTVDVGDLIASETAVVEYGSSHTIDVLANDADPTLRIVSVDAAFATISADHRSLVVTPPGVSLGGYQVHYTAMDSMGCMGTGTLSFTAEYPNEVLVGAGLVGDSFDPVVSGDGRYVAFVSGDNSLVPDDTNAVADVFVLDTQTHAIERMSKSSSGVQANDSSATPAISADGRWVAFSSHATNLAAADTTAVDDIYLHDRTTGVTLLISGGIDGAGSDQPSLAPQVSDDGNRIAFQSAATRLVDLDTNASIDVFVRDRAAATTTRVSITAQGAQAPSGGDLPRMSADGRYITVRSNTSLDVSGRDGTFVVDTAAVGAIGWVAGLYGPSAIDATGRHVAASAGSSDVFVFDRQTGNTQSIPGGVQPALSGDGRYSAYVDATNGVFHAKVSNGTTSTDIEVARDGTGVTAPILRRPDISRDGRWVVIAAKWPGYEDHFSIVRLYNRAAPL